MLRLLHYLAFFGALAYILPMLFDGFIERINGYIEELRGAGRAVTEDLFPSPEETRQRLPIKVGRGAGGGFVLMEDVGAEVGAPGTESISFVLWSDDPGKVVDGRVRLVGPDLPAEGEKLSFGLVSIVAGPKLTVEHQTSLEAARHVADRVEGFMVRSLTDRTWGRVHKDAISRGFKLMHLGAAMTALFKEEVPDVERAETLIITSSSEDVKGLAPLAEGARKVRRDILVKRFNLREDGIIECTDGECDDCDEQEVCDDIRDIAQIRRKIKKDRED